MLPACYIAGWQRRAWVVCGVRLHPLTLDHARVLYIAESPYIAPTDTPPVVEDLLLGVAVCSRPLPPAFSDIAQLQCDGLRMTAQDMATENRAFAEYIKYWVSSHPRFSERNDPPCIPWPWMLAAILMAEFHYAPVDAWKTVCADALWMVAAHSCRNGNRDYATLDMLETMHLMEEAG